MKIDSTFVINLPKEQERKKSIDIELKKSGIAAQFITAFDGHDKDFPFHKYESLSGNFWKRTHNFKPGAFACYLSHAKCWEEAIKAKSNVTLILEDDVSIDTKELYNLVIDESIENFDVIFINNRTYKLLENLKNCKKFVPVSDVLENLTLNDNISKKIPAPGSDGYIISLKGATKLLQMMRLRKISMGVDYALFFNSLTLKEIINLNKITKSNLPPPLDFFIESELTNSSNGNHPVALESYIYSSNKIIDIKDFKSSIDHNIFLSNEVFNLG